MQAFLLKRITVAHVQVVMNQTRVGDAMSRVEHASARRILLDAFAFQESAIVDKIFCAQSSSGGSVVKSHGASAEGTGESLCVARSPVSPAISDEKVIPGRAWSACATASSSDFPRWQDAARAASSQQSYSSMENGETSERRHAPEIELSDSEQNRNLVMLWNLHAGYTEVQLEVELWKIKEQAIIQRCEGGCFKLQFADHNGASTFVHMCKVAASGIALQAADARGPQAALADGTALPHWVRQHLRNTSSSSD